MKRLLILFALIWGLVSCNKNPESDIVIFDRYFPYLSFVIVANGVNIFEADPNTMYEVEVIYNGQTYKYTDETRTVPFFELALHTRPSINPYILYFSDFNQGESGSLTLKFRDNEWRLDFSLTGYFEEDEHYIVNGNEITRDDFFEVFPQHKVLPFIIK